MEDSFLFKTWRAIIATLLMELARVANLKPRIGKIWTKERNSTANLVIRNQTATAISKGQQLGHQTSEGQQLGHQTSATSTKYLETLDLDENHPRQEPNTPEENHQVPETKLDFKGLVE
jgi:hypothetical protein